MPQQVYHDDGARFGRRTRVFRDGANGGVEWMYAVDYAAGCDRWYGFSLGEGKTISRLQNQGFDLHPFELAQGG